MQFVDFFAFAKLIDICKGFLFKKSQLKLITISFYLIGKLIQYVEILKQILIQGRFYSAIG
jgi:hypothetical protein